MEIRFPIYYHPLVLQDDLSTISRIWKAKIKQAIEQKLVTSPEVYGKPLRRSLKGYRKLRVGDYRVVFRITGSHVYVMAILHRSVVYDDVLGRL